MVGYRCPPDHTKFQPGKSGNPAGRCKGQPTFLEVLEREAARLVKVKVGDDVATLTKREVVARKLYQKAMEGDARAMRLLFAVMNSASPKGGDKAAEEETAKISLPARPDDDTIRRMLGRFPHLLPGKEDE